MNKELIQRLHLGCLHWRAKDPPEQRWFLRYGKVNIAYDVGKDEGTTIIYWKNIYKKKWWNPRRWLEGNTGDNGWPCKIVHAEHFPPRR